MKIRSMLMEDYEEIYKLWMATPGMGLNDIDDSKEGIQRYLERNPNTNFVAVKEGFIIGVILSGHDGRRGYIHHTAVAVSERRQGIGRALLSAAISALEHEKISKIALVVFRRNENGNQFWEGCGFTVREDIVYRNKSIIKLQRIDT